MGADINASVYRIETQWAISYFVKVSAVYSLNSMVIIDLLRKAGVEQIISPVSTFEGKPTLQIDDLTMIVYPFIPGQDGFSQYLSENQWQVLGGALKKIHDIAVPPAIQDSIRRESYSHKWREALRAMLSRKESDFAGDEIAVKLWAFIKENMPKVHRLIERAEQLAKRLQRDSLPFVLCHSDIHGGNVLITEQGSLYIVDWDDPIMAPKERDLMFIGGGVGNVWNKPHEENLFYKGYGRAAINRTALSYYRHERIVEDITEYCQEILFTTTDVEEKRIMYGHFMGMFAARGVVEIAFETDEGYSL
ncbi:MAG: aminoglycoside phosphotransferase family protein [Alphaproteobacteria bacterium]|nr:aminoglycoside phosphotransferase family protein [Alphaproteobacteria bacterium]